MKTNRGDMPASPTHEVHQDCGIDGSQGPGLVQVSNGGLTIREELARTAMKALLSNPSITRDERRNTPGLAVRHADARIAELERTEDQQ